MSGTNRFRRFIAILRWLARLWNGALVFFAILEATGPSDITRPVPWQEWLSPVFLFAGAAAGFILCWRWERAAGVALLAGYTAAQIAACFSRGACLPANVIGLTALFFVTPGVLYLACWYLSSGRGESRPRLAG